MFGQNPCPGCKAKDDEIKHLRGLVDSILIGKGLAPVSDGAKPQAEPAELDVKESLEAGDIKQYGGE